MFLDGAFERAGAELRIVAFLGQISAWRRRPTSMASCCWASRCFEALQLDFDDGGDLFLVQAVENDDVVDRG